MSRVFIDRPIFAWVIAILVMLAGVAAILKLPVEQFPDIAPPQVVIQATYPGASPDTLEASVTQILEQQLTGLDHLLYFASNSNAQGQVQITVTFAKGTDPDIAQVQVQNKLAYATSRLPAIVQAQGLRIYKSNPDQLLVLALWDETDRATNIDVSDFLVSNLQDAIGRIEGVGDAFVFGSQYAMRIWLDPHKLASYSLVPADVVAAITAQNTEVAAGELGGVPSVPGQALDALVTARSRLRTPEDFARIVLKANPGGGHVHLADVARIELGAENYGYRSRVNGHPGTGMAISLAPGADALKTAALVKAEIERQAKGFPAGYAHGYANDTTLFIRKSVEDVVITLIEAIVLVVVVMFVSLQSWRATLIPAVAVPVVLLGTFGVLSVAGYSINTLTLFGLVLAIGLLVDDAIVVVENVERLMHENPGMTPREATRQSMGEISVALVAIALVLSAVFLPMAFFGGSTGVIYRQFSLTIVASMALSVMVALILTPALTATMLKRREEVDHSGMIGQLAERLHHGFEARFARLSAGYQATTEWLLARPRPALGIFAGLSALLVALFWLLPTGFLPGEDQGFGQLSFTLPAGATIERTQQAQRDIERYFLLKEGRNIKVLLTVAGAGGGGGANGQNAGRGFFTLVDWDQRKGADASVDAISRRATMAMRGYRDLEFFATVPAVVRGLGQSSGFSGEIQNTGNLPRARFVATRDRILAEARADPVLANIRLASLPDQPTLNVAADDEMLTTLGLNPADVNATLATAWGGRYVNDFLDRGRVKRVYVQGDAPFRTRPEDLVSWQVRGSDGQMVPYSAFSQATWKLGPTSLYRFNGIPNYQVSGQAAPGHTSGQAMAAISAIAARHPGVSLSWSGASFQERLSTGQAPILYGVSLLVVFLCLAALFESWTVPVAVLLIVPLGLLGAVLAVSLRGLQNDVYLQVGLTTTMGLAAKNAILMIEFALHEVRAGKAPRAAVLEAARIRLRPILMTSSAFIFGVLPLALASGAGANSRIAIGTSVLGGMLSATVLAVFYVPLFFVMVQRPMSGRRWRHWWQRLRESRG